MIESLPQAPVESQHLRRWQRLTLALMFFGYAGYYVCRVHLSVATPLLIDAFHGQGVDKAFIGHIVSLGTLCYAAGKFVNGSIVDFLGGRRMFLFGMVGAIVCTLAFGLGGLPLFTMAWMANRLVQSTGWAGLVRITSRWFAFSSYSTAMGVLNLSFLLGDVVWRFTLGKMIESFHLGWQGVFYVSAATLSVIFAFNLVLLKESPQQIGEPEPPANPDNLYRQEGELEHGVDLKGLLLPLLRSPMFWTVCAMSFGLTLVRETFGNWSPEYLHEVVKMSTGRAAQWSAIFPLFGAVSTLACGFLGDRLGKAGRALLILGGLALSIPALIALGQVRFSGSELLPLVLLACIALCVLGPYTYLAGVMALDFGGKRGSATASGWIDGVGYVAGIVAGEGVGRLAEAQGWAGAFNALAGLTAVTCLAAVAYWRLQPRIAGG